MFEIKLVMEANGVRIKSRSLVCDYCGAEIDRGTYAWPVTCHHCKMALPNIGAMVRSNTLRCAYHIKPLKEEKF